MDDDDYDAARHAAILPRQRHYAITMTHYLRHYATPLPSRRHYCRRRHATYAALLPLKDMIRAITLSRCRRALRHQPFCIIYFIFIFIYHYFHFHYWLKRFSFSRHLFLIDDIDFIYLSFDDAIIDAHVAVFTSIDWWLMRLRLIDFHALLLIEMDEIMPAAKPNLDY